MTCERVCSLHGVPLLDLVCAYQHGTKWDAKTRTRIPNFETNEWLHVEDGVVVAEVAGDRIRWLRQEFEGGTRKLAGRHRDGTGGRPWSLDASVGRL